MSYMHEAECSACAVRRLTITRHQKLGWIRLLLLQYSTGPHLSEGPARRGSGAVGRRQHSKKNTAVVCSIVSGAWHSVRSHCIAWPSVTATSNEPMTDVLQTNCCRLMQRCIE